MREASPRSRAAAGGRSRPQGGAAWPAARPWDQVADPEAFGAAYRSWLAAYTPPAAGDMGVEGEAMEAAAARDAAAAGVTGAGTAGLTGVGTAAVTGAGNAGAGESAARSGRSVAEVEWKLFKEWTARLEESLTLIHAAVLGRGGRAVVAAGRTGNGKTTLALALLARGWTFLSDDCAVLAPDEPGAGGGGGCAAAPAAGVSVWPAPGGMHVKGWLSRSLADSLAHLLTAVPYPRGFFAGAGETAACCLVRPEAMAPPGRPWPVAAVLLLDRRGKPEAGDPPGGAVAPGEGGEDGGAPALEPLRPGRALADLIFHSFARTPAHLARDFRLLARLVRSAPCHRLRPGDPHATAALVADLVGPE